MHLLLLFVLSSYVHHVSTLLSILNTAISSDIASVQNFEFSIMI